jgi:hypothetical protein
MKCGVIITIKGIKSGCGGLLGMKPGKPNALLHCQPGFTLRANGFAKRKPRKIKPLKAVCLAQGIEAELNRMA